MNSRWQWLGGTIALAGVSLTVFLLWPRESGPYHAPAPRLPKELVGDWVQVYPKDGAFTRIHFAADSSLTFSGTDTAFQSSENYVGALHPDRWYVDALIVFGSVCLIETRRKGGDCYSVRVAGDTMWMLRSQWPVLVRASAASALPHVPWSDPHLKGVIEPNSNSFRDAAPILVRGRSQ